MKKTLLIFLITAVFISISGCGKNEVENPNAIKFWHFWSEPNQKQALKKLIEKFEKENDCVVELSELSWNDGKTKLVAAFNSNATPDVVELGSDWVSQFSSSGVLAEIATDFINYDNFLSYSLPPTLYNTKYYAIPWVVDTRVMFYNKELMSNAGLQDVPPKSYTELIDFAQKINTPNGGIYGFGANGSDQHRLYKKILPMMWSFGGDILDSNNAPTINSSMNTEALNTYLKLSRVGLIETQRQIDALFSQGKIAFCFSGAWLLEKIKNENPSLKFGVTTMPAVNNNDEYGTSFLGCEYLAMSNKSDKKDIAIKLIKFLSDGANAIELSKCFAEAGFPADRRYFNNEFFLKDPIKSVFAEQLNNSKATPVHPQWLDIEAIIEEATSKALYGDMDALGALNYAQVEILKLLSSR